jgi:hypothetical protein
MKLLDELSIVRGLVLLSQLVGDFVAKVVNLNVIEIVCFLCFD